MLTDPLKGGALLARILTRTRTQGPALTPAKWSLWAARRYSTMIHLGLLPADLKAERPRWSEEQETFSKPLNAGRKRMIAFHRKRTALLLMFLADERVTRDEHDEPDPECPWYALASRWAATYDRLPGGDIPEGPGLVAELAELRCYEVCATMVRP